MLKPWEQLGIVAITLLAMFFTAKVFQRGRRGRTDLKFSSKIRPKLPIDALRITSLHGADLHTTPTPVEKEAQMQLDQFVSLGILEIK